MSSDQPRMRCAVYTRKSTDEGLSQEFNSLDAQRLAGENFIASLVGEGWECLPDRYDDGGYTGGNTDRPALQRLLDEIEAGEVDCVVVYKVDRLSRSLLDFAKIMEVFDEHNVAFVSVTQSFNSSNSMGRLTLNILLSFAQFEREVISERTRDKIHMARKKGKWSGGSPVLGYDPVPGAARIVINEAEAQQVRAIFGFYLEHRGLIPVIDELDRRGWKNKTWVTRSGKLHKGKPFTKPQLHNLLTNPIYTGKIRHHGEVYPGEHDAIVEQEVFDQVQAQLKSNRRETGERFQGIAILRGLLRCKACNCGMVASYSKRKNVRYRYYLCQNAQSRGWRHCPHPTLPAAEMERFVAEEIRAIGRDKALIKQVVAETRRQRDEQIAALLESEAVLKKKLAAWQGQPAHHADQYYTASSDAAESSQRHLNQLRAELGGVRSRLRRLRDAEVSARSVSDACNLFDPVWDSLTCREQRRILQLLIARIDFDAENESIAITFHETGIKALTANPHPQPEEAVSA